MTTHVHKLKGCAPAPLAHYLKALGIFRLVAEQKDPSARAFWKDDVFHLVSSLDEEALVTFICDEFAPTPLLSPWNGGSGFYPKDAKVGFEAIERSTAARLNAYREAIAQTKVLVGAREARPDGDAKAELLRQCHQRWPERALDWFSAAVSLSREGAGRYPALLGTGGNDGRLDFTNNFMQRLVELVDMETGHARAGTQSLARLSMFGAAARGLQQVAIGQFLPGGAGGANGTAGFDGVAQVNPWDFVLMLEGAILLRVAALRRLDGSELAQAAAPFAFRGLPGGYGSAAAGDDGGRGEQWVPLWTNAVDVAELRALFAEARVVRGATRSESALDAARALALLGTARGIESFVRFGFMERNGQANLAVPLDRVHVRTAPLGGIRLLDELDTWLDALRRAATDKHAPLFAARAARRLQSLALEISLSSEASPRQWTALVEALGETESLFVHSPRFTVERRIRPLPRLSSRWLERCDDGSVEFRLARGLASLHTPRLAGTPDVLGPIRAHCIPLDAHSGFNRFSASADALRVDPRVVWTDTNLVTDLSAVVVRRILEGKGTFSGIPLEGRTPVSLDDVMAFVDGRVDERRVSRLTRGLMSVEPAPMAIVERERPLPLYALFRAANLDASHATKRALPAGLAARCDAQAVRLLAAGRLAEAARVALARLGAMGLRPKLRHAAGDAHLSARLAASLAFPLSSSGVARVLECIAKPFDVSPTETA